MKIIDHCYQNRVPCAACLSLCAAVPLILCRVWFVSTLCYFGSIDTGLIQGLFLLCDVIGSFHFVHFGFFLSLRKCFTDSGILICYSYLRRLFKSSFCLFMETFLSILPLFASSVCLSILFCRVFCRFIDFTVGPVDRVFLPV